MKRYLIPVLAALTFSACEDYTEKNFGSMDELWNPTEVNNYSFTLSADDYNKVAQNASNVALAEQNGVSELLQRVANKGAFNSTIEPAEYLPALFANLVGSKFYACTAGSTITVKYNMETTEPATIVNAYSLYTADAFQAGKYAIVPQGTDYLLTSDKVDGEYGYLSGIEVERVNNQTLSAETAEATVLLQFVEAGDNWYICNSKGAYLYMDGTHASFQYVEDLGDLDDTTYAEWSVSKNEDGSYAITCVATNQTIYWSQNYKSAGAYDEKTDDRLTTQLYRYKSNFSVNKDVIEEQEIVFTLDEDGEWGTQGAYLDMALVGAGASSVVDEIYSLCGWSIEYNGGIGDLTYVWRLDATYGLRASAYKNPTYYPTDAWAISPRMNLKKAVEPIFTFEQAQKYAGTPVTDFLRVYVSTNYTERGQLSTATWDDVTDLVVGTWPDGSNWDYSPMTLDLSKYAGNPDVRIAFRYISTDAVAATWEVKNVLCKEAE